MSAATKAPPEEATVIINGTRLTGGQSMTIRVALESFDSNLAHEGLGDDAHGQTMVRLYRKAVRDIRKSLYSKEKA